MPTFRYFTSSGGVYFPPGPPRPFDSDRAALADALRHTLRMRTQAMYNMLPDYFGVYDCFMCGAAYTVNDPGSYRLCSPDYCHDCYEMPEPQ
jgi:hypothetical protein